MSDNEPRSQRDYELAEQVVADTPARLKALGDPLRLTIVDLVLERAMTVTELADRLGRPKGSVAYHVDVLVDAGLIQVVRTRKVRAIEERFYGRVARTIIFPDHSGEIPFLNEVVQQIDLTTPSTDVTAGFTFRHARIPRARAMEYADRLQALALEFVDEPRGGDIEYGLYVAVFPTNRLAPPAPPPSKPKRSKSATPRKAAP